MRRKEKNGIHWLEFELLADIPNIIHGVFLKHGGASLAEYCSLNVGDHVGDQLAHVTENRKRIADILQVDRLVTMKQCHGKTVHEVCELGEMRECDAMMTSKPGFGLMIMHADCQAALIYDPVHHVVANVHAGWKGSVHNIYEETIVSMQARYGSRSKDLLVCISPSLGPQSAEFINYRQELPEPFWKYQHRPNYFDFWEISRSQLIASGVQEGHIEVAGIDTVTNAQDFFSFRKARTTGRNGTIVALR